jgi:hypothetical protein
LGGFPRSDEAAATNERKSSRAGGETDHVQIDREIILDGEGRYVQGAGDHPGGTYGLNASRDVVMHEISFLLLVMRALTSLRPDLPGKEKLGRVEKE